MEKRERRVEEVIVVRKYRLGRLRMKSGMSNFRSISKILDSERMLEK